VKPNGYADAFRALDGIEHVGPEMAHDGFEFTDRGDPGLATPKLSPTSEYHRPRPYVPLDVGVPVLLGDGRDPGAVIGLKALAGYFDMVLRHRLLLGHARASASRGRI
jgi:hypothetical protein